jgi:hypothetical protein
MAKEKRYHCPECAENGIVKPFVSGSALEMHRTARHPAIIVPPTRAGRPNEAVEILVPRTRDRNAGAGAWLFLAAVIFIGLIAWLGAPALQRGWASLTDPTAVHD